MDSRSCSVKTETKVKLMGWVELVGALVLIVGITNLYTALFVMVINRGDKNIGRNVLRFYNDQREKGRNESYMTEFTDDYVNESDKLMKEFTMWLIPEDVDLFPNKELVGMRFKSNVIEFFGITLTVITVALIIHCLATFTMLIGAYKKRRGFVFSWMVLAVLEFIVLVGMVFIFLIAFPITSSYIPFNLYTYFFIACSIRLYMNMIAYRFWKEIGRKTPKHAGHLISNMTGDKPLVISMANPNHCFDSNK